TALVDGDLPATPGEQDRQQRAGEAGADQGQGAGVTAVQGGILWARSGEGGRARDGTGTPASAGAPALHFLDQLEYVGVAVVQRHRGDPDHVRLAPVAEEAA